MMDSSSLDGGDSGKCQRLKWNADGMEKAIRLSSVTECLSLQLPSCFVSPGRPWTTEVKAIFDRRIAWCLHHSSS